MFLKKLGLNQLSEKGLNLDSAAVSIFVVILVELTNTDKYLSIQPI